MPKQHNKEVNTEQQIEKTLKQQRLERREREQHRNLYIGVGIAVGAAIIFMIIGLVAEFALRPGRTVATVGEDRIVARDFWKRVKLEQNQLQNALSFYQFQEQQLGNQGFFTNQISQLQSTLVSPFALGQQALDQMIEEKIIEREAAARSIMVSDEEVEEALREEIAASVGTVTGPQATATWEAWAEATAEAALWTPTPAATEIPAPAAAVTTTTSLTGTDGLTETGALTETAAVSEAAPADVVAPVSESAEITPTATAAPLPTPAVITDTAFTEGLSAFEQNLRETAGMTLDDYREVIRARLLRERLAEVIAAEEVAATEEQVRARHILVSEIEPTPTATAVPEGEPTPEPTPTATAVPAGEPAPTATPAPRTREDALALAQEIRQQIVDGADFAEMAALYSDDTSNKDNGGDLGWFNRQMMVEPFTEAAFALPVGEVSEPVSTTFGVHLIQVDEKDPERAKDAGQLEQERSQAFDSWLQEQIAAANVQRNDVTGNLPRDLEVGVQ